MSKLSLSRAWEETKSVLTQDGRLFLAVALALFVLPGLVLNVIMPEAPPGELPPAGPWVAIAFAAMLVSLMGQLAVIRLALEPHVAVGEAISHGARRLAPYVLAVLAWLLPFLLVGAALSTILAARPTDPSLPAALGLILLACVGMFVAVRLILSSAVASAERIGPLAIIRRSWDLSRGNWWRLFAFLVLFVIAAICSLWAAQTVFGLLVSLVFEDTGHRTIGGLVIALVSQLISAIISVIFFVLLARIYVQRSGEGAAEVSVPRSGT